ncbi:unnamed protein product [Peniophora sp. CBMAI 1063]|nr:unnamed protein product [Peniophora sp. CBMAI 1063]
MAEADSELRQRAPPRDPDPTTNDANDGNDDGKSKDGDGAVVWGRTPSGTVFRVPTTHDVVRALLHPAHPKSHLDMLNITSLALQLALFLFLPPHARKIFFFLYFAFWRAAYDGGLGVVLTWQSKRRWIVREIGRRGWLDPARRPGTRDWIRRQLVHKMGADYSFDALPVEYNAWLLFRQAVDIILINDFLSYVLFALSCVRVPTALPLPAHVARLTLGGVLVAFNVWVKSEAHAVVTDYGWYWGDCFFARGALVFDGVFELAPHPMYTVGYAWLYGLALLAGSYPVLLTALAAHAAQFAFLALFENPHIERFYGQRRPLAERVPIKRSTRSSQVHTRTNSTSELAFEKPMVVEDGEGVGRARAFSAESDRDGIAGTPSVTEGESATETELETETEEQDVQVSCSPSIPSRIL